MKIQNVHKSIKYFRTSKTIVQKPKKVEQEELYQKI